MSSIIFGANLVAGSTYSMIFHVNINSTTSGSGSVNVLLPSCTASAVTLSNMSARPLDNDPNLAALALGGLEMAAMGCLVAFVIGRR